MKYSLYINYLTIMQTEPRGEMLKVFAMRNNRRMIPVMSVIRGFFDGMRR